MINYSLTFDVGLCLDYIGNQIDGGGLYSYSGSLNLNTQIQYDALTWFDGRPKPAWADILTYMPSMVVFYYQSPASAGDVDDLYNNTASALSGKAAASHSHAESDITGLAADLAAKAAASHTHPESDIVSLVSDLAGKAAASHSHAESDVTGLTSDLAGKLAASFVSSTPSRSLNSSFMPSSSKYTMVLYTVQISCSSVLGTSQSGTVQLMSDASSTPTTARCNLSNTSSVSLVGLTAVNTQQAVLMFIVPPNHYVKLVSSGNATISLVGQTEIVIG